MKVEIVFTITDSKNVSFLFLNRLISWTHLRTKCRGWSRILKKGFHENFVRLPQNILIWLSNNNFVIFSNRGLRFHTSKFEM